MREALGTPTDPTGSAPETAARPRSVLLNRPGAVAADGPDAGVAAHYGDPHGEQRALAEGRRRVDLSHRGVVASRTGPAWWLHSHQHPAADRPRTAAGASLVLSPHGHVEHDLHLVDDGRPRGSPWSPALPRTWSRSWTRCGSCSGSRSLT